MSATQHEIQTAVMQFLRTNFLFDEAKQIPADQSLLGAGIVDSTGILEMIGFLEDTYGVKFLDDELVAENFDSLERIGAFMTRKIATSGGTPVASA